VLTALLLRTGGAEKGDYILLFLALVAVLGVLRGLWPAPAAGASSFLLVDFFFVPPVDRLWERDAYDDSGRFMGRIEAVGMGRDRVPGGSAFAPAGPEFCAS